MVALRLALCTSWSVRQKESLRRLTSNEPRTMSPAIPATGLHRRYG